MSPIQIYRALDASPGCRHVETVPRELRRDFKVRELHDFVTLFGVDQSFKSMCDIMLLLKDTSASRPVDAG